MNGPAVRSRRLLALAGLILAAHAATTVALGASPAGALASSGLRVGDYVRLAPAD